MHIDTPFPLNMQQLLHRMAVDRVLNELNTEPLWRIAGGANGAMLFDPSTGLLWDAAPDRESKMDRERGNATAATLCLGGLQQWRIPTLQEIKDFGALPQTSSRHRNTLTGRRLSAGTWLTTVGTWSFDHFQLNEGPQHWGVLLVVNDFVGDLTGEALVTLCLERNWTLASAFAEQGANLLSAVLTPSVHDLFADIDYVTARLPRLDTPYFNDPTRGLWELWGLDQESLRSAQVKPRNPADDVLDWDVAIDFGTSSTVVAYNENGRRKLLRVGMDRFWEEEQPDNYQNPTALEFRHLKRVLADWYSTAYRPLVKWDDVRCSHAALEGLENPNTMLELIPNVLTGLKQWAMRGESDPRVYVRYSDKTREYELAPLTARNPVLGTPLSVSADDPFDPIELYAWFLGMNINWRGRGLFLRYYMSFPVAYPEDVRDKILASFRRGLQRSLPATLVDQPIFAKFRVEELATEPAAYAAAALPALGIEPTAEGVAYAVFDFGGGTTDFDFGRYRLPNQTEDEELEEVIEHCGSSGDAYLGGEHLLANMAYLVFLHNLALCGKEGITFVQPVDAPDFPGHEMYVENSRIATTNTAVMVAALRPLWEQGIQESASTKRLRLINRAGDEIDCEFAVPLEELSNYLISRIWEGIESFFIAMRQAFDDRPPAEIHVLLAGNASRSEIVESYFFSDRDSALFGETVDLLSYTYDEESVPAITVHRAPEDETNHPAMGKTGVALGLLRLCPGGVVAIKHKTPGLSVHEAPFAYFVGRIRRGTFQSLLRQGQAYGTWVDLGSPRDRVLRLAFTRSPLGYTDELSEGDKEVMQRRLEFGSDAEGKRVFARAIAPHDIELCLASSVEDIEAGMLDDLQAISLQ